MMKGLCVIILALTLPSLVSQGTRGHWTGRVQVMQASSQSGPHATIKILHRAICGEAGVDTALLNLVLGVGFNNAKGSDVVIKRLESEVSFIAISKSPEDAARGQHEVVISNEAIAARDDPHEPADKGHSKNYKTLRTNHSSEGIVRIALIVSASAVAKGVISPGVHYLQVGIPVWTKAGKLGNGKNSSLQGMSRAINIVSDPIPLNVSSNEPISDCSCRTQGIAEGPALALTKVDPAKYSLVAYEKTCVWTVIAYPKRGFGTLPSLEFIIDKLTGEVLYKVVS